MNFDGIFNYYENLVYEEVISVISKQCDNNAFTDDDAADIACLALNQLPARYVRHRVDAAFFIDGQEHDQVAAAITKAVQNAIDTVKGHSGI